MSIPKHESPQRISPACLVAVVVMVFFAVSLGGVRLYSLYLEYRLSDINSRIEAEMSRRVQLEIKMASMLSPERIYVSAKNRLGMKPRSSFQVVRLVGGDVGYGLVGDDSQDPVNVGGCRAERRSPSPPTVFEMAGEAHAQE
ncbi:MAG: hypothetical protein N2315_01485 [Thermanaerothrix sp.]|nr:hypothetical protein [Thermanaerothrix sp.]